MQGINGLTNQVIVNVWIAEQLIMSKNYQFKQINRKKKSLRALCSEEMLFLTSSNLLFPFN